MTNINLKKTVDLHKYRVRLNDISKYKRLVIPIIFSIVGILFGSTAGKGEGNVEKFAINYFTDVLSANRTNIMSDFFEYLLIPSIFIFILFFLGLSVFGGLLSNAVPFTYGAVVGVISYHLYNQYTLKGLAYCVILIFPYAVLSLLGIVLCTDQSIKMSEYLLRNLSENRRYKNYSFKEYYKRYLKNFIFVIIAAAIKALLEYLFGTLFSF